MSDYPELDSATSTLFKVRVRDAENRSQVTAHFVRAENATEACNIARTNPADSIVSVSIPKGY